MCVKCVQAIYNLVSAYSILVISEKYSKVYLVVLSGLYRDISVGDIRFYPKGQNKLLVAVGSLFINSANRVSFNFTYELYDF